MDVAIFFLFFPFPSMYTYTGGFFSLAILSAAFVSMGLSACIRKNNCPPSSLAIRAFSLGPRKYQL